MQIEAGCRITYDCPAPVPMLLMISPHPSRAGDLTGPQEMGFHPPLPHRDHADPFGNLCTRIVAPAGRTTITTRFTLRDPGRPDPVSPTARQLPVELLPHETLPWLLASRYCDMEHLNDFAWARFGHLEGWARVQAISDFVHGHLRFGYAHASATRTAAEALAEGQGVCRDYAHLAIALCRCLNIPARYCTGYLGDIGVPPNPDPMDFAAWCEVYLEDGWHVFDPRHNQRRIGRILVARGRDATDVAIATTFGPCTLAGFEVMTDELVS